MTKEGIKTIKVPLRGVWPRDEYLDCRSRADYYNKGLFTKRDEINCSFCKREIYESLIHVVEYGAHVACQSCFRARYRNRRQLFKHIPIPPDLDKVKPQDATTSGEALRQAKHLQDKNVAQLRESSKNVDPDQAP